jgi:hypothetical protein
MKFRYKKKNRTRFERIDRSLNRNISLGCEPNPGTHQYPILVDMKIARQNEVK